MSERVILHSDMNCFYASVEMLHHPEFAGMPLAVGGDPEARHGIVLTANYIAKRKGVKTGMALWQAKQICPEIIFVPPRMDLYLRYPCPLEAGRARRPGTVPQVAAYRFRRCPYDQDPDRGGRPGDRHAGTGLSGAE